MANECPVCGKQSEEEIPVYTIQVDGNELADYVFDQLVGKGYVPKMKEINTILDIVDDFMLKGIAGLEDDN